MSLDVPEDSDDTVAVRTSTKVRLRLIAIDRSHGLAASAAAAEVADFIASTYDFSCGDVDSAAANDVIAGGLTS